MVQRNLTSHEDYSHLHNSCVALGIPFIGLDIIPFTHALPDFDKQKRSVIYGSTTFNRLAYEDQQLKPGLFFDEASFSIQNYLYHWGSHMLNHSATVTTFRELFLNANWPGDKQLFIRPDDDSKSFSGGVKRFDELTTWYQQLTQTEDTGLTPDTKIVVAQPWNIACEWRLWMVNKKMVAASQYRRYFKLSKQEGCPPEVQAFAEARALEYTPHDIFVMDICQCGDGYYIVECGSMNGAGFYHARIHDIVRNVSDYFAAQEA
ncbi:hypothetical protein FLA_1551 [Filimonas lacunae]|nr:hypothetical protein FLA_1551 [Filimonas lacunae]